MNDQSSVFDSFYKNLMDDFIENGNDSVMYDYYYDLFDLSSTKSLNGSKATSKKADQLMCAYKKLGNRPSSKELVDFTAQLLTLISSSHILYDYPFKPHTEKRDFIAIYDVVKAFIFDDEKRKEWDTLVDTLRDEVKEKELHDLDYDKKNKSYKKKKDPSVYGRKISKKKLHNVLKESVKSVSANKIRIKRNDVFGLADHVRDRMIYKAFDDFLFTAGYRIIQASNEGEDTITSYVKFGEGKGRGKGNTKKIDKTLELIYRYYLKRDFFPVEMKVDDNDYKDLCKEFFKYLNDHAGVEGGMISIPLAVDRTTGCSLQLIGSNYFENEDLETSNKYCGDTRWKLSAFVFAVLSRCADGMYAYEYYNYADSTSGRPLIFTDLEIAIREYKDEIEMMKYEISENNAEFLRVCKNKKTIENIPMIFRRYFIESGEEDELTSEDYEEAEEYHNIPYDSYE